MQANNLPPLHKYFSSVYLQEPVSLTGGRMAEGLWASDQLTFLQNSATAVTATCTPYSAQWNSVGQFCLEAHLIIWKYIQIMSLSEEKL